MIPQFLGGRRNTAFSMEHPPLSSSSAGWEDGARRMGTSPQEERSDQRAPIDLFYSASGPDMFALVTSILQEPSKPEAETEWESNSFLPSCPTELDNNSRYSSLFPMDIWDNGSQANLAESRSSCEEKSEKASPTELLVKKFDDLQVTGSSTLTSSPPSQPVPHEVLKPRDPQNVDFTRQVLYHQPIIVSEGSEMYYEVNRGNCFPPQVSVYGEHQEGIARGQLGASGTSKPILLSSPATAGIWLPATQENQMYARRCSYESPQYMSLLLYPFQQGNSIPKGANARIYQNQQQNFPVHPSTPFNNVRSTNPAYPLQDSSNRLFPAPGFQQQSSSYGGDKHIKSGSLNLSRAPCVTYQKPQQMNTRPWATTNEYQAMSPINSSVVQPFGSQAAPQKCGYLQNCGFSNYKANLQPHNSAACSPVELRAPQPVRLGEISRNIPPPGWAQCPPADRFAKCHGLDSAPKAAPAGQKTGQSDGAAKMEGASGGPDWTPADALRSKKKMHNLFEFINPSFLPLQPLAGSQIPNFPAFQLPPFSLPCPPFPANPQYGNVPDLSHLVNGGDTSLLYHVVSPPLPHKTLVANYVGPTRILYMQIEECYKQWRALERERSKMEADLANNFPKKPFATFSGIPYFRLRTNPSRVDRLIWIQFQEQAKVTKLLEKMDQLFGVAIHENILLTLDSHLEAIRTTLTRRRDELLNSGKLRKKTRSFVSHEEDVLSLALAVNKLTDTTRKTRTALWCAFQQIAFPKNSTSTPGQNALDQASIALQIKNLTEDKDEENEEAN